MYLIRIDPDANMERFYRIQLTTDLFGGTLLLRQWGRLGTRGQERRAWFANTANAQDELQRLTRQKLRRGYQPA